MVEKKFRSELLIAPLAAGRVAKEVVQESTDIEVLKEILKFAMILVETWHGVRIQAERRLERLIHSEQREG